MIQNNVSLKKYNTFGINVSAKYFSSFNTINQLKNLIAFNQPSTLILGGGSNILFTKNFDGLVLKNDLTGIELVNEDENNIYIKAAAGENWHQFVLHCIKNNWAGLENLSLIPGNVGASPIQNIGAYGVEIKDVFYSLEAFHLKEKKMVKFNLSDCKFGYRESIFKTKYKSTFAIISVTYKLNKHANLNISYGSIEQELEKMGVKNLSIKTISDAIINIRSSKLPNPAEIGNAGSFFKNPEISNQKFLSLQLKYPNIIGYSLPNENKKLAAGWLIEQCGFKGYRIGDAGCHNQQALVLVNYKNASGEEIFLLSKKIIDTVKAKFDVELEREVNIL